MLRKLLSAAYASAEGALAALSAGIVAKTSTTTYAARTITGTSGQVDVSNGDGVSGNPTVTLAANSACINFNALGTGLTAKTAAGTVAARAIVAGAGLTGSNLDGVSGNPTLAMEQQTKYFTAQEIGTTGFTNNAAVGTFSIGAVLDGTVPVYRRLQFTTAQSTFTGFVWRPPSDWDLSTITATIDWTASAGSVGGVVVWDVLAQALSDDDPLNPTLGAYTSVSDALLAQNDTHTCTTGAITVAGTPAAGDLIYIQVRRAAGTGSDNLGQTCHMLGIGINYNLA